MAVISLKFDPNGSERQLERCFSFMLNIGNAAGIALLTWACAAGAWRAWQTVAHTQEWLGSPSIWLRWLLLFGGTIFYTAGALGTILAVAIACGLAGGLVGFLFGTPRLDSSKSQAAAVAPAQPSSSKPASGVPTQDVGSSGSIALQKTSDNQGSETVTATARSGLHMSPALTEIADWLTKIIVGLGLVEARSIGSAAYNVVIWILDVGGFGKFPIAGALVPATMIIGLAGGFMFGYLFMSLLVARELATAAIDIDAVQSAEQRGKRQQAEEEVQFRTAAGQLRALDLGTILNGGAGRPRGTASQRAAARVLTFRSLESCTSSDDLQAWAKGQVVLGNLDRAVEALQEVVKQRRDPNTLFDLGMVLQSLGRTTEASAIFNEARSVSDQAAGSATERVVTRLEANPSEILTLLYANPPQPEILLTRLDDLERARPQAKQDATVQMWRACAEGQKYRKLKNAGAPQDQLQATRDAALQAVKTALAAGMSLDFLQLLINPRHPDKADVPEYLREDDLEPFYNDPEFRMVLQL